MSLVWSSYTTSRATLGELAEISVQVIPAMYSASDFSPVGPCTPGFPITPPKKMAVKIRKIPRAARIIHAYLSYALSARVCAMERRTSESWHKRVDRQRRTRWQAAAPARRCRAGRHAYKDGTWAHGRRRPPDTSFKSARSGLVGESGLRPHLGHGIGKKRLSFPVSGIRSR